jgi:predicted DCC family thiol-disulfide oxidoreductase YuxK
MQPKERLTRAYLTADPRSLALGRIALASVLLADLIYRSSVLRNFYTNAGLLPNHTLLWRPLGYGVFSFFFMASSPFEAGVGFLLCGAAYLCLLIGFRTRLAQVASFLAVLSLHTRVFQNGGDIVLGELCLWTMFLPTGRRYSVDSLRARLRMHPERAAEELTDRSRFEPDNRPVVSLAFGALLAQLICIYLLNAIQKNGTAWRTGTAIHYVLHQDAIVTRLGLWVRGWITPGQSWLLTRATVATEALLPLLLLSPVAQRNTRHLAIALAFGLHLGFVLFLDLEMFTPAMLAFLPNLLPSQDFDAIERRFRERPGSRLVLFDGSSGVCFQAVRLLARFDRAARLDFLPGTSAKDVSAGSTSGGVLAETIVVVDPASGKRWFGVRAFAEIARWLPGGRTAGRMLALPGIRTVAGAIHDVVARHRRRWSDAVGWVPCGSPFASDVLAGTEGCRSDVPCRAQPGGRLAPLRELVVALLMILAASELLVANPVFAAVVRLRRPAWIEQCVSYLQLIQSWSMFAPDVKRTDMNVSVDAVTADGRHVDPFNEVANPQYPFPGASIPPHLNQNSFFLDWALRVPWLPNYHQAFLEWVLRYPDRTGRPSDRIVSFQAFVVEDDSPPPGERQPRNLRTTLFYRFPE